MAKTTEELNALKAELQGILEKLKELEPEEVSQVTEGMYQEIALLSKSEISLNFEEDTIPVSEKDMSAGLKNY